MAAVIEKRNINDRSSDKQIYQDSGTPAARLQNFIQELADDVRSGNTQISQASMAHTDAIFALDAIIEYMKNRAISSMTTEKNRQLRRLHSKALFLQTLEKDGGVYNSAQAAEILGKTKTTVRNWKDAGQLLALEIDGEFYYPVFQFTEAEAISDKGVLKGVPELLKDLVGFSDRMRYSFFMEERNTVLNGLIPAGRVFTIAEILKNKPDQELMAELHRLARVYGTQDVA
ncbi:hypothetical protein GTU79_25695 [Sodalis ligni]|uniref:hypothetical protein n=1 Tax=Sodalis ligni TaxID=2697027 RepID=UPI00194019BA|nr:hypothetical protein [Sodalis ligni]QWA10551.1 hypothetical protein GTU79_25695 [Sodalis ligni]